MGCPVVPIDMWCGLILTVRCLGLTRIAWESLGMCHCEDYYHLALCACILTWKIRCAVVWVVVHCTAIGIRSVWMRGQKWVDTGMNIGYNRAT